LGFGFYSCKAINKLLKTSNKILGKYLGIREEKGNFKQNKSNIK
jgi:hypothetical protein